MPSRTLIRAGFLTLALALLALFGASPARATDDDEVRATLAQLRDADFDGKTELIEKLVLHSPPLGGRRPDEKTKHLMRINNDDILQ